MLEQEQNKKKIILFSVIVILVILVVTLLIYLFVTDNNDKDDSKKTTTSTTTTNTTTGLPQDENKVWSGSTEDLLKFGNISDIKDSKDKIIKVGKFQFKIKCNNTECEDYEILINDKSNNIGTAHTIEMDFIVVDDLAVIYQTGYLGQMSLVDNTGYKMHTEEVVISYQKTKDALTSIDASPTYADGKLHYYIRKDDSTLTKKYIDFNNGLDQIEVEDIEGYVGEY